MVERLPANHRMTRFRLRLEIPGTNVIQFPNPGPVIKYQRLARGNEPLPQDQDDITWRNFKETIEE